MSDIVERLRNAEETSAFPSNIELFRDAADEIERLRKDLEAERKKHEWVPVEERTPEQPYGCLLIVWDYNPMNGDHFLNYLPYFAGWDGEQWNDEDGIEVPFEVAYWMPLPDLPEGAEE